MLHHILGHPRLVVLAAIEDHTAIRVASACYSVVAVADSDDRYAVDFYLLGGRVIRCERDLVTGGRDLDEYSGGALNDFKAAHKLM